MAYYYHNYDPCGHNCTESIHLRISNVEILYATILPALSSQCWTWKISKYLTCLFSREFVDLSPIGIVRVLCGCFMVLLSCIWNDESDWHNRAIYFMHSEVVEGIFKVLVYIKRKIFLLPPFSKWLMGIHPLHPLWLYRLEDTGGGVAWGQETYVTAAGRACLIKSCRALRHYGITHFHVRA